MGWKLIEGYRYPYRINDQGLVQKLQDSGKWKTIKPWSYRGQMKVHFRRQDGGVDRRSVSGLVADYFLGGTPPGTCRVHRNGLKSDNGVQNIKFMTRAEAAARHRPANSRPVAKINREGKVVALYSSQSEAARKNHISQQAVSKRCAGLIADPFRLDDHNYVFEEKIIQKKRGRPKKCQNQTPIC